MPTEKQNYVGADASSCFERVKGPFTAHDAMHCPRTYSTAGIARFSDYGAFIAYGSPAPVWGHDSSREVARSANGWRGAKTWEHAVTLAREGWPEGRERAETLRAALAGVIGSRAMRPKISLNVAGFAPCVPAAVAGSPESMMEIRRELANGSGKIISIVYNMAASAGISAESMMLRGAVCLALIDALESSGFRCSVTLAEGGVYNGELACSFAELKATDEPLNVDALAFWLVNPAALRRFGFAVLEQAFKGGLPDHYGTPAGIPEQFQGDLYLADMHLAEVTNETAPAFVREQLVKFGVEFEN